ncbi:terminase small subunit [Oligella urethralis]|uniref:terminase small subunit n=1 Tax=Oligella urethralis TaxID=90245 RepID=UPI000E0731C8|nr:terminase small subunit [Oligella urethralis]SUA58272.1 Terminase small subunit [Oligella urethralis]
MAKGNAKAAPAAKRLTPKQEAFCLAYIETGNASEAYRQAYSASRMKSATVNSKAYELLRNGEITARIDELKANHAKRHEITVDDLIAELEEARQLAIDTSQSGSAVTATMGKAKLLGLDKQLVEHSGEVDVSLKINVEFE